MKLNQEFWVAAPDADGFGTHWGGTIISSGAFLPPKTCHAIYRVSGNQVGVWNNVVGVIMPA